MAVSSIIVNLKFLLWQIYPIQFNSITWELAKSWQNNERRKGFSLTTCSCRREKASSGLENSEKLRSKRNDWRACWQRLWQKPAKGAAPFHGCCSLFLSFNPPPPSHRNCATMWRITRDLIGHPAVWYIATSMWWICDPRRAHCSH